MEIAVAFVGTVILGLLLGAHFVVGGTCRKVVSYGHGVGLQVADLCLLLLR